MQTTTFRFNIGGVFGNDCFEVILKNDELHFFIPKYLYSAEREQKPTHIIPIKEETAWLDLLEFLKSINWKHEYLAYNVLDGTCWKLEFKHGKQTIKCTGSNDYPPDFDRLLQLIKEIIQKYDIPDSILLFHQNNYK